MKTASMTRSKGQVYSVGNYLMTGKVLGKGHFARVEEATHRVIGKKVAIKIIDLTCIKEEYARRHLHREPRVMAKLRHPCIAALYETMMHGPRLYVVMEAAGGGDLCAHVLSARGAARGLPEPRARALAAQLVSAVRHMHARGVVHRDLKMENIMLDSTKQFIKIVDFGLSNIWSAGGALRTPCGSLEYAAPELFVDGRRYGPEVDLWSIGVIVYGMVTGGLPFTGNESGEGKSRPQLRAAIARGFTRKQRAALACVSTECKTFIQQLLEPEVEARMKIEEAARHRWIKRPGMRMKTHPFGTIETKANRELFKTISELSGQSVVDVVAEIKAEPFGALAGMYNIKTHLQQLQGASGIELLWSGAAHEPRPPSPPQYRPVEGQYRPVEGQYRPIERHCRTIEPSGSSVVPQSPAQLQKIRMPAPPPPRPISFQSQRSESTQIPQRPRPIPEAKPEPRVSKPTESFSRPVSFCGLKKPVYKIYDSGDCLEARLPRIEEHSGPEVATGRPRRRKPDERVPIKDKRIEFYRRAGDAMPSWRASGVTNTPPTRILLQTNATTIKRASLGNIVSPHSSSNSHCKSERSMPVGWYSTRSVGKEPTHLQRLRRTAPMK